MQGLFQRECIFIVSDCCTVCSARRLFAFPLRAWFSWFFYNVLPDSTRERVLINLLGGLRLKELEQIMIQPRIFKPFCECSVPLGE